MLTTIKKNSISGFIGSNLLNKEGVDMITKQQPPKSNSLSGKVSSLTMPHEHDQHSCSMHSGMKTRIVIKYDVGYGNTLSIRGHGANLSWEKGQPMKNTRHDEWVWETEMPFTKAEFKVMLNDKHYEAGPNHILHAGSTIQYTPHFS